MNTRKIIITGVGPSNPDLITERALKLIRQSELIIIPRANINKPGTAENIILNYFPDKILTPVYFPMTRDFNLRDKIIYEQIIKINDQIKNESDEKNILFPVIGDSALYSTGKYLYEIWKKIDPNIELELIPGISAHSLAASCAKRFLSMDDEILSIIPGTANHDKILNVINNSDVIAIYKPSAIKNLSEIINTRNFKKIIRVDHAGFDDEKIFTGPEALKNIHEYMSVILLWK